MSVIQRIYDEFDDAALRGDEIVSRGNQAEQALHQGLLFDVLMEVEAGALVAMAGAEDPSQRDGFWVLLKGIGAIRDKLHEYVAARDVILAEKE